MKKSCGIAGFTLIEIIVALGLSSIVAVALLSMYYCACSVFEYQLDFTDIQYAERTAMQMIIDDVMAAQKVEYLDDHSKLCLTISDGSVSYYVQNNTVYRRHRKLNMPVANDINRLSFWPDYRSGYTVIAMEGGRGEEKKRLVCSAIPRTLLRSATADAGDA